MLQRILRDPLRDLSCPPQNQVPALDALRAIAVLLVIFCHSSGDYLAVGGRPNIWSNLPLVRGGWMGVDLFFVLSGYLIGKQLWRELQKTGTIRFRRFFLRRGLRIWPLYFGTLIFSVLVWNRGRSPLSAWWSDVVFLTNYVRSGRVAGGWSLCIEEQFYLLTPLAVLLGVYYATPSHRYRWYLLATLALLPVVRALEWWWRTGNILSDDPILIKEYLYSQIHVRADGLVAGLLIAHLDVFDRARLKEGWRGSLWVVLAAALLCAGLVSTSSKFFNYTGFSLFFASLVWVLLARPRSWLGWLDARIFYVLSRLSFGMYLNHQFINAPVAQFVLRRVPMPLGSAALQNLIHTTVLVVLSMAFAGVTFFLIEHPFLRLREVVLGHAPLAPVDGLAPAVNRRPGPLTGP